MSVTLAVYGGMCVCRCLYVSIEDFCAKSKLLSHHKYLHMCIGVSDFVIVSLYECECDWIGVLVCVSLSFSVCVCERVGVCLWRKSGIFRMMLGRNTSG